MQMEEEDLLTATGFVSAIDAIDGHVAPLMRRDAVRFVEDVLSTRDLTQFTFWRSCKKKTNNKL